MKTQFVPIGSAVTVQHMPEDYYQKWGRLHKQERRSFRAAFGAINNPELWANWRRASERLVNHENQHNTD